MSISNGRFCRKSLSAKRLHILIVIIALVSAGCNALSPKVVDKKAAVLLSPVETADKARLINEINRLSQVKSMRGKVDVKFEDNTFAESGIAEKYKSADGQVIVQAPSNINLKIQLPIVGTDIDRKSV